MVAFSGVKLTGFCFLPFHSKTNQSPISSLVLIAFFAY